MTPLRNELILFQNSLFSTQHSKYNTVSCMRRVEKGESRRQRLCRLVPNTNKFIFRNKAQMQAYIKDKIKKPNRHNKIFKDEDTKKIVI